MKIHGLIAALVLATGPAIAIAQTSPGQTGPGQTNPGAGTPPAAGETSDRTPEAKTETPLPQRDKTTADPAGTTATPPKPGTTSDRTPDSGTAPKDGAAGDTSGTKGKTTTGEGAGK